MKLSETVSKVIALAEAIRTYWDTELPKRHPDYPFVHPGEDSGPPPPEAKKLKNLLARQPEDVIYKLALIMCLGRGDFGADDLAAQYAAVKQAFGKRAWAAARIREKASLADDLQDGLAELKRRGIDVDQLLFTSVNSRS
jgi:hypothetical protein